LPALLGSKRFTLLSIIVIWSLVRIYPVARMQPLASFEIWQAQKLLDYGFVERQGAAILAPGMDTGKLPNPRAFNRTHHPFPVEWFYAFIFQFSGRTGVVVFLLAFRLTMALLVFYALERHFERFSAWFATVLYCLAPCGLPMDTEIANPTELTTILLPLGAILLARPNTASSLASSRRGRFVGWAVFLAGQIDWFALTMVPSLLVLAQAEAGPWRRKLKVLLENRLVVRICVAALVTTLVFLAQVVFYEADVRGLNAHLAMEAGAQHAGVFRARLLLLLLPLRFVLFVGLPLVLGCALSLRYWRRPASPLVVAALVCLGSLGLMALMIPQYFLREISVYTGPLFPAAVLAAAVIQRQQKVLPWVLAGLCLPGIAMMYLYASVPRLSNTSKAIAQFIAAHSAKTDAVLTNLEPGQPPYAAADVTSSRTTRYACDRLILFGCQKLENLREIPNLLRGAQMPLLFVLDKACPIAPDLLALLGANGRLIETATLDLGRGEPPLAARLRAFVFYKVMRKGGAGATTAADAARRDVFEVYKLSPGIITATPVK
jgi:hypothetical protein